MSNLLINMFRRKVMTQYIVSFLYVIGTDCTAAGSECLNDGTCDIPSGATAGTISSSRKHMVTIYRIKLLRFE